MLGMTRWISLLSVSNPQEDVRGTRLTHHSIGACVDGGNGVGMTSMQGAIAK